MNPRTIAFVATYTAVAVASVYLARLLPGLPVAGVHVPISFMPFLAAFAGVFLGARNGALAMGLYLLLGLLGFPVFAGGSGGFAYVLAPTFGYILGYVLAALTSGWIYEALGQTGDRSGRGGTRGTSRDRAASFAYFLALEAALLPLYGTGIVYMWGILNFVTGKPASLWAIAAGMGVFFVKDVLQNAVLGLAFLPLRDAYRRAAFSPTQEIWTTDDRRDGEKA
ncbi:MAG: Substrate-specific component BioY of biotin ECF transporter [Brockia lithotrophica]|uniref:Biotin transporter n=1 Tax=Brockia lithotrophica TaxID=933949 RepID=A0A2T5G6Y9_9BACL|nr:biotin transporter BioY [Brockia lithotrophica]MBT9253218.1 biotin transporter BioY [Brockia lithotrophica]PTQ51951.1 MAG: Substrate-specific component BioY of biotin ECF transporter [Brockia lithotrophica]